MHAIEKELTKATGLTRKPKQTDEEWFAALAKATANLPDPQWQKISDAAQTWTTDVVDALNSKGKKPMPSFTDEGGEAEEAEAPTPAPKAKAKTPAPEDETTEETEEAEEPAKPVAKKPAAKPATEEAEEDLDEPTPAKKPAPKPAAAPAKKAAAPKPAAAEETEGEPEAKPKKKKGAGRVFKRLMLENPDLGMKDVLAKLREGGDELSENSAAISFYETRQVLEVLEEMGLYTHAKPE